MALVTYSNEPTNIVDRARRFAKGAHDGQLRSDMQTPFINHAKATAHILEQVTDDANLIAAGWLHDVIEDCDVTYEHLIDEFNEDIAHLVRAVTKNRQGHYPNLDPLDRRAAMLKFADRLSNIADLRGWDNDRRAKYLNKSCFWDRGKK